MVNFADVTDVTSLLVEPEVGEVTLDVPPEWATADEIFQTIRDTTNEIIGALGHVGVTLDPLPDGSLADLLIKPFSGDYDRIRANGTACQHAAKGMRAVAKNVAANTADMGTHWSGDAAGAFSQQAAAYAAVATAASFVMDQGFRIFDVVADRVQDLAELAIKIIVRLAKILVRLSSNIASRFAGWLAWIKLAKDLATEGLDPIIDIYEDIKATVDIVKTLFELGDAIEAYVESIRQTFSHFLELPALASELPNIVDSPLSSTLRTGAQAKEWRERQKELAAEREETGKNLDESLDDAEGALDDTTDPAETVGEDQAE